MDPSPDAIAEDPFVAAVLKQPFPGYDWPLSIARNLARSQDPAKMKQAVELLRGLTGRYPTSLPVVQEYVLALIESKRGGDAEAELARLGDTFQGLDMELLCRWGRIFKDKGDLYSGSRWVKNPSPDDVSLDLAITYYREAISMYARAFALDGHYYPGINETTLQLIVAALEAARHSPGRSPLSSPPSEVAELAKKVVAAPSLRSLSNEEDEKIWKPATRGEACLLMQDWAAAAGYYRQVLGSSRVTAQARDSMGKQVHRIAEAFDQFPDVVRVAPFDTREHIDDFFLDGRPADSASTAASPAT